MAKNEKFMEVYLAFCGSYFGYVKEFFLEKHERTIRDILGQCVAEEDLAQQHDRDVSYTCFYRQEVDGEVFFSKC